MPVWVDPEKCNGCYNSRQPPCVRMCPGDLIVKDHSVNKAYLKYTEDCWDCLPCVKACPEEAIEFHLSYQFGSKGAKLAPHVHKTRDFITWEATDIKGKKETFTIRTKVMQIALDENLEDGTEGLDFSI